MVVLAFTRVLVVDAADKPGSKEQTKIVDTRYPTVWNQIEASMAFGLDLPLLVILEKGLYQEAMLKDRLEFRVRITPLNPAFFQSEEFKGVFADFKAIVEKRAAGKKQVKDPVNEIHPSSMSVGQILSALKGDELWKVGAALVGLISALVAGAFWLGTKLASLPAGR